jgi:hypothetical protein
MPPPKIPPYLGLLLTLGWSLALWITGGVLLGHWADTRFSLYPWGVVTGALAGIAGCGYTIASTLKKLDEDKRN